MKIAQINYNYNKSIHFLSNQNSTNINWEKLINSLSGTSLGYKQEEIIIKTNSIPTFNKPHFTKEDYKNLSDSEKLIIKFLCKIGQDKQESNIPRNLSMNKYAEHILDIALKAKEELDKKYQNGYRLVGIGRSPAPFVETMELIGADTVSMPFSRQILYGESFPYMYLVGGPRSAYHNYQEFTVDDWKNYFKYFGADNEFSKKTGKTLIFTDDSGETLYKTVTSIIKGLNFDKKNTEVNETWSVFHQYDCKIFNVKEGLAELSFKHLAKMISVNHAWALYEVNPYRHPEFIPSLSETFMSKLFRCALYNLIAKKKLVM